MMGSVDGVCPALIFWSTPSHQTKNIMTSVTGQSPGLIPSYLYRVSACNAYFLQAFGKLHMANPLPVLRLPTAVVYQKKG